MQPLRLWKVRGRYGLVYNIALAKIANKFLASLTRKVRFGVWIDILAKKKFANLSKNFLFFSFFYFNFVYFIFLLFCDFFYKMLSIMLNEEIFYSLQQEFAYHTSQIAPTWEEIIERQAQASTSQPAYNFGGVNSFNNAGYISQPHSYRPSYNHSGSRTHDNLS